MPPTLAGRRILIADDNQGMRQMLVAFLRSRQAAEVVATEGPEALDAAAAADFDVVITDLDMPGLTGEELVTALRANPRSEHTPVLVLTGSQANDAGLDALRAIPGVRIASKPVKLVALEELLTELIDAAD